MKKIFVLIVLLMFVFSGTALANERWQWILSTDKWGLYFDKQTVRIDNNNYIDVWIKRLNAYPDENNMSYSISNLKINPRAREISLISYADYDVNGEVLYYRMLPQPKFDKMPPDSSGERISAVVTNYMQKKSR